MLVQLRRFFSKTQFRKTKACTNWRRLKHEDVQLKTISSIGPFKRTLIAPLSWEEETLVWHGYIQDEGTGRSKEGVPLNKKRGFVTSIRKARCQDT